jgi:hypothetical protein
MSLANPNTSDLCGREDRLNYYQEARKAEECGGGQQRALARSRTGLLKFFMRVDLLVCYMIIPIGIFIARIMGISQFVTLVGVIAVLLIAGIRALLKPE